MAPDPKVFLITGASSGIGEATARHAAAAGYRVVLAARSTEKLEALAKELGGLAVTCDVTEWEQQQAMVERALAEYGRIDVAFANAGFGAERGFKAEDHRALAGNGADERLRRGADDPRLLRPARRVAGAPAADGLTRRPARPARLALLLHEVRGHRDGRGGAARAERDRRVPSPSPRTSTSTRC